MDTSFIFALSIILEHILRCVPTKIMPIIYLPSEFQKLLVQDMSGDVDLMQERRLAMCILYNRKKNQGDTVREYP